MENTDKIRGGAAEWYVAVSEQPVGPLTAAEVLDKLGSGQFSWVQHAWKKGQAEWVRLCDLPAFREAMPRAPQKKPATPPLALVKEMPPPPSEQTKSWYLYYNDSQFGPFSSGEVDRYLRVGKLHGRVFAWKDGMAAWTRLEEISDFSAAVPVAKEVRQTKKPAAPELEAREKRHAPRIPVVAKLIAAGKSQVSIAVCRDISVGGMQVLTDSIPGEVGSRLKLNVSPGGMSEGKKTKQIIEPFVAEGEIVRILEDGRGYSFRFSKLSEKSRKAIESYIKASEKEAKESRK